MVVFYQTWLSKEEVVPPQQQTCFGSLFHCIVIEIPRQASQEGHRGLYHGHGRGPSIFSVKARQSESILNSVNLESRGQSWRGTLIVGSEIQHKKSKIQYSERFSIKTENSKIYNSRVSLSIICLQSIKSFGWVWKCLFYLGKRKNNYFWEWNLNFCSFFLAYSAWNLTIEFMINTK